jgi:hypothetical protein
MERLIWEKPIKCDSSETQLIFINKLYKYKFIHTSSQHKHRLVHNQVTMGECAAIMKWSNITVGWGKCLRTEVIRWNGLTIKWGVY